MISKRARRTSAPQESLRQFALNNSKGVNSTKAPTDGETVYRASNLIVNHDGSMSLRKPIVYVENTGRSATVQQFYLYDNEHRLEVDGNTFRICDATDTSQPVKVTYTGYDDTKLSITYDGGELGYTVSNLIFPEGTVEVVNLNSATVLGNCKVDVAQFGDTAIDAALYDNVEPLPRYIQIYYAETDGIWTMAVKPPEINVLTTSEGEASFNPNLTLDNPLALRDVYGSVVPTIRGIIAYVGSDLVNGSPAYAPSGIGFIRTFDKNVTLELYNDDTQSGANTKLGTESTTIDTTLSAELEVVSTFKTEYNTTTKTSRVVGTCNVYATFEKDILLTSIVTHFDFKLMLIGEQRLVDDIPVSNTFSYPNESTFNTNVDVHPGNRVLLGTAIVESNSWTTLPSIWRFIASVHLSISDYTQDSSEAFNLKVNALTESNSAKRFRPVVSFKKDTCLEALLKVFCNLPATKSYYARWEYSTDYVTWSPLNTINRLDGILVREVSPDWMPDSSVENDTPTEHDYVSNIYYPLVATSERDNVYVDEKNARIDVVPMTDGYEVVKPSTYRFKIISVSELSSEDTEWDPSEDAPDVQYRVYATVAQREYTPVFNSEFEFFDIEFENTVYGNKLYHKKALYSYGSEKFKNNIFVSDIDSFVTPLYNIIDLDTYAASSVTCLLPWRDYLVSATENAVYLHTKQSDGYLTKTVNTSVGISEKDARCCKAVLNGILFKAGSKIYQLYPNIYAGDDSTLNLTEISAPIAEYLDEYEYSEHSEYTPFAFSTETEYILMLPKNDVTLCLRYDYSAKIWTVCTYPVVFTAYKLLNLDNIRLFGIYNGTSAEYVFDAVCDGPLYGDVLPGSDTPVPIEFEWDTGQKTDGISLGKQFVESKLMFATMDDMEAFPMSLTVTVDGDPHITTIDVNTDAPFWKNNDNTRGVAGTAFRLSSDGDVGVLRQLVVRYSGKGRSIRHILSGSASSNFKMYEAYVRYKILNTKK